MQMMRFIFWITGRYSRYSREVASPDLVGDRGRRGQEARGRHGSGCFQGKGQGATTKLRGPLWDRDYLYVHI